jgi:gliding motility-associated-like protein
MKLLSALSTLLLVFVAYTPFFAQTCRVNLGPDVTVCTNATFRLNPKPASPGARYDWFFSPNVEKLSCSDCPSPSVVDLRTPGTYIFVARILCVDNVTRAADTIRVTVVAGQAPQYRINRDTAICKGSQVALGGPGVAGTTYRWSSQPFSIFNNNQPGPVVRPNETTKYFLRASNTSCPITSVDSIQVRVDSLPFNMRIRPRDTMLCAGAIGTFSSPLYEPADFRNVRFRWTPSRPNEAGVLTSDTLYNLVVQPINPTTAPIVIIYRREASLGVCRSVDSVRVTVPPVATITPSPADTLVCPGQPVTIRLTVTPGVEEIEWEPKTGIILSDGNKTAVGTFNTSMMFNIKGKFMGCPVNAQANVRAEIAPVIITQSPLTPLCGTPTTLTASVPGVPNPTYLWNTNATTSTITVSPTANTTYAVSVTYGTGGVCRNNVSRTVTITTAPLTVVPTRATICSRDSSTLTASSTVQGTYTWSTGPSGATISVNPAATTAYTVTLSYNNGCTVTRTQAITVATITPEITTTPEALCAGTSTVLTANASGFAPLEFRWSTEQTVPSITVTPTPGSRFTVTVTNSAKCTATATILTNNATISIAPLQPVCPGSQFTLTSTLGPNSTSGGSYSWVPVAGGPATTDTLTAQTLTAGASRTYTVTYSYGPKNVCRATATTTVQAQNLAANIISPPNNPNAIYELGDPIRFEAILTPPTATATWTFRNNNNASRQGNAISYTPQVGVESDTLITFPYTLKISSGGCVFEISRNIIIALPDADMPNLFSPNGDGTNDVFRLAVRNKRKATTDRLEIYNRWGQKIFESTAPNAAWDGKVNGGDEAPIDVYVYRIFWRRGDGALQAPKQGEINLIR